MIYIENSEKFCQFCLKTSINEEEFTSIDANIQMENETKKILELFNTFGDDYGVFRECQEDSIVCNECLEQLINTFNFYKKCVKTQQVIKMKRNLVEFDHQMRDGEMSENEISLIRIPTPSPPPPIERQQTIFVRKLELMSPVPFLMNNDDDDDDDDDCQVLEPNTKVIEEIEIFEFECVVCKQGTSLFPSQSEYLIHLSENHEIPCISCETCGAVFNSSLESDSHRLKHLINSDSNIECEFCSTQFPSSQSLEYHSISHSKEIYCLLCLKSFITMEHLASHVNSHIDQKILHCIYCSSQFRSPERINEHIRENHIPRRFICGKVDCQARFTTKDQLQKHQETEHKPIDEEKPEEFNCKACKKTFQSKTSLTQHLETHLNGAKFIPVHTTTNRQPNNHNYMKKSNQKHGNFHQNSNNNLHIQITNNGFHQNNRRNSHQKNERNVHSSKTNIKNEQDLEPLQGPKKPVKRLSMKGNVHSRLG